MPWGLLVGVSRVWGRVLDIADTAFVWVAPCLLGLLVGVSHGLRCVLGITDQGLVWVAPCLWDC